jgi:hypothetical protein
VSDQPSYLRLVVDEQRSRALEGIYLVVAVRL